MGTKFNKEEVNLISYRILRSFGVDTSLSGFNIAMALIWRAYDAESKLRFTGEDGIYAELAPLFNTTKSGIERAVRHLITCLERDGNKDSIKALFPSSHLSTNSAFIYGIVNYIKYELGYVRCVADPDGEKSLTAFTALPQLEFANKEG